jgi:acetyl esterase/lipase
LQPNIPLRSKSTTAYERDQSVWAAVSDRPMTRWDVPPSKRGHVLLRGLDINTKEEPETPTAAKIEAVSPLAQVHHGNYCRPTFIVHPREDDLIPWEQAQRMDDALRKQGIESHLRIVDGVPHLFDMPNPRIIDI